MGVYMYYVISCHSEECYFFLTMCTHYKKIITFSYKLDTSIRSLTIQTLIVDLSSAKLTITPLINNNNKYQVICLLKTACTV